MALPRVYVWEVAMWPEFQQITITPEQAGKLLRKLCRHFKTPRPIIQCLPGKWGGGTYRAVDMSIELRYPYHFDTVLHEFAHHLNYCRNNVHGHGCQFKRELKQVHTWAKRYLPLTRGGGHGILSVQVRGR